MLGPVLVRQVQDVARRPWVRGEDGGVTSRKPLIGPAEEPWASFLCGYSPKPGDGHCRKDALWHGVATGSEDPAIGLASCESHLPQMRLSADYAHPLEHPCCVPGALFVETENRCVIEWDDAELLAASCASVTA